MTRLNSPINHSLQYSIEDNGVGSKAMGGPFTTLATQTNGNLFWWYGALSSSSNTDFQIHNTLSTTSGRCLLWDAGYPNQFPPNDPDDRDFTIAGSTYNGITGSYVTTDHGEHGYCYLPPGLRMTASDPLWLGGVGGNWDVIKDIPLADGVGLIEEWINRVGFVTSLTT